MEEQAEENLVSENDKPEEASSEVSDHNTNDSIAANETNKEQNKSEEDRLAKELEAEKELQQKLRQSRAEFCEYLAKNLKKDQLEINIRACSQGLFVAEDFLYEALKLHTSWLSELKHSDLSANDISDKHILKLFGSKTPSLYYILHGKQAQAGFLIECEIKSPQKLGLSLYKGEPLSAYCYLHPRDSKLLDSSDISFESDELGQKIVVRVKQYKYELHREALLQLCTVLRNSTIISKKHPQIKRSLRDLVFALPAIFSKLRPHKGKLLIPSKFREVKNNFKKNRNFNNKRAGNGRNNFNKNTAFNEKTFDEKTKPTPKLKYLSYSGLVLGLDQNSNVHCIYQLKGVNRHNFIREEFNSLLSSQVIRSLPCRVERNSKRYIANCEVQGIKFHIETKVFSEFLELLPKSKNIANNLPKFYTLYDAFKTFINLFKESSFIDSRDIDRYIPKEIKYKYSNQRDKKHPSLQGRLKGSWVFLYDTAGREPSVLAIVERYISESPKVVVKVPGELKQVT